mmetsp:Transcript_5863/g.19979  ORF Transcript_5863/g.19979 Transcript_5863/m.19979 type:complete len:200 (+) Transcript_5863:413-1012(+)
MGRVRPSWLPPHSNLPHLVKPPTFAPRDSHHLCPGPIFASHHIFTPLCAPETPLSPATPGVCGAVGAPPPWALAVNLLRGRISRGTPLIDAFGRYAFYWYWIMLGTSAPGEPAWNTSPETAQELLDESINYFYLNIFLHYVGGDAFPSPVCHPVSEGLFNFVNAWSLMFGPLMARDEGGRRNGLNGTALWLAANFLTNV